MLAVSVTLLLTSALLMMAVYAERRTGFLLYSVNALLLIAAGIVGVALAAPGSPFRLAGARLAVPGKRLPGGAAMRALGEAKGGGGTTVEKALAAFFENGGDTL